MKTIVDEIDTAYEEAARWRSCIEYSTDKESKRQALTQTILWEAYGDLLNDMENELASLIKLSLIGSGD